MKETLMMTEESFKRVKPLYYVIGREFTHKQIFDELRTNGLKKDYMKEALYNLLLQTPFQIDNSSDDCRVSIDVEKFFKKKSDKDRKNSIGVQVTINGISSDDPKFYEELEKFGEVFELK